MNLLFLAFSNNRQEPLPNLQQEEEAIYRALAPRALRQEFLLHRDSYASLSKIAEYLTLFRAHLFLFHYSGHAGKDKLILENETGAGLGIAGLLKQCPKLQLVVLNGCSTQGQVQELLNNGIPVVIATSAPVEDIKAMRFGQRFYQALAERATIKEAFDIAISEIIALDSTIAQALEQDSARGLMPRQNEQPEKALWGIFTKPGEEAALSQTLPAWTMPSNELDFEVNERLIESLWESLAQYSEVIQILKKKSTISLPRKRMAILNRLPAPVAEHLRKLLVPVDDENDGYDTISTTRLKQIIRTSQTVMELLTFTLMAQLWETFFENGKLNLLEKHKTVINTFLLLPPRHQEVYDYLDLIRTLREVIEQNGGQYFMEELADLLQGLTQNSDFHQALFFLEVLKVKLYSESVEPQELPDLCQRSEECLAKLLSTTAFLSKYALVSVQKIDVRKFRHTPNATFSHVAVELRDLLGGLEVTEFDLNHFMDNQSILMLNDAQDNFLNLSPFIIDINAFEEKTNVSKLYFVSHFDKNYNHYCFKPVYKPEKKADWIYLNDKKYTILRKQFDAFKQLLA